MTEWKDKGVGGQTTGGHAQIKAQMRETGGTGGAIIGTSYKEWRFVRITSNILFLCVGFVINKRLEPKY